MRVVPGHDNARNSAGVIRLDRWPKSSALVITGRNAANVRAIKADIGQFAIAKLGQFADIALIVPERLDHANEREQHNKSPCLTIQLLRESFIVEMNIVRHTALQKFQCCGAAKLILHSGSKEWLTFRHGWLNRRRQRPLQGRTSVNSL